MMTVGMLREMLEGLDSGVVVGVVIDEGDGSDCVYAYELVDLDSSVENKCLMLVVKPEH